MGLLQRLILKLRKKEQVPTQPQMEIEQYIYREKMKQKIANIMAYEKANFLNANGDWSQNG